MTEVVENTAEEDEALAKILHPNVNKLAEIYGKMNNKIATLKEQITAVEEEKGEIVSAILKICEELGVTTMRTAHGTISKRIKKRFWTNDWDAFRTFMKAEDALALCERRIAQANMEEYLANNPDKHPPGLNVEATQTIVITKSRS